MSRDDGDTPQPGPAATVIAPAGAKANSGRLPPGATLNDIYRVSRFIGRGGMGEVYEAVNVNTDERVAIKVIPQHLEANPTLSALLRREANTLVSLSHPALVQYRVFAHDPDLGVHYLAFEYVDGPSLEQKLGELKVGDDEIVALILRLAEGLGAAHQSGVVHRDISPDNILLPGGRLAAAKIIDFGIAKDLGVAKESIVGTGFAGKFNFAAPEQFGDFDRAIGPWTDIYSLGLVMLALARGEPVDMGTTFVDAIDRRRTGPDLSGVSPGLKPLLERMLVADPQKRLRSMDELIALAEDSQAASGTVRRRRSRSREPAHGAARPREGRSGGLFVSYARADRTVAEELIRGLRAIGVDVWWDEEMPGVDWQAELERQITELAGVVVIWTVASTDSKNVRDEARLALTFDKLVNVVVDVSQPPFPFDRVNALPLSGWRAGTPHNGWTRLVQTIEALLVEASATTEGALVGAQKDREREAARRQRELEAAKRGLEAARSEAEQARAAAEDAARRVSAADQQLKAVVNFGASPAILKTAHEELDAAHRARDEADRAQREAAARLDAARRELGRAEAELAGAFAAEPALPPPLLAPSPPAADALPAQTAQAAPAEAAPPSASTPPTSAPPEPAPVTDAAAIADAAPVADPAPVTAPFADLAPASAAATLAAPESVPAEPATPSVAPVTTPPSPQDLSGEPVEPPRPRRWLVPLAVAASVVGVIALAFVIQRASTPTPAPPLAASTPSAPAASDATTPAASAETPAAVAALEGAWTPTGLSCDNPLTLSAADGVLSVSFLDRIAEARIGNIAENGVVTATGEDGDYVYRLVGDTLSVTAPNQAVATLTRCVG